MESKELALLMGISHQFCNRLKKRGMPTDCLESAKEWRRKNLNVTSTKKWRIDGNPGMKQGSSPKTDSVDDLIKSVTTNTLTHLVPDLWFSQAGWLGTVLKHHGVTVSSETLLEVQGILFMMYMDAVDELLEKEVEYKIPDCLMAKPEDDSYPSLIQRLNQILINTQSQVSK